MSQMLMMLSASVICHNIPMATNLATAELLVKALDRGDMEWREMYK